VETQDLSLGIASTLTLGTARFGEAEVSAALGGPVTLLGRGTFGDTWRFADTAVKIICVDGYPPARLSREVDGLNRVKSPHVVRLLATRIVNLGGFGRPALVFEFIEGGDLSGRIVGPTRPTIQEAMGLLRGLLAGARDLHATGTVHRDIKPGNVALRQGDWEQPVLLDLGLARSVDDKTFTVYPGLIGTARYMAPEQLEGRRARKAADLFAIGVTVRELLAGRHPFYESGVNYTFGEAQGQISMGPAPLPTDVPAAAVALLDRLVAPAEHDRGSAVSAIRRLATPTDGGSRGS